MVERATDTILRVGARDLFIALSLFNGNKKEQSFESLRIRFCIDRKTRRKGDFLWSRARDVATELRKLGLAEIAAIPRDRQYYKKMKDAKIMITENGKELISLFNENRAEGYDSLFVLMFREHGYLRALWKAVERADLIVPVATSIRDHVSARYANATNLSNEVAEGKFALDDFLERLSERSRPALLLEEQEDVRKAVTDLIETLRPSASQETAGDFAKKFLDRLNEATIPIVMRRHGVGFDFRTHRTLWLLGQEFYVWFATSSHPGVNGTIVFSTAKIDLDSVDPINVSEIRYETGMDSLRQDFLERLYKSYENHRNIVGATYVPAWELRAVFCHDNSCQPTVFNKLLDEQYVGSTQFKVQLEIERARPRYESPVVVGKRRIGTIAVTRR